MFGIDKIKVICLLNCLTLGLLSHVGDVNYYKTEDGYLVENTLQASEQDIHLEDFFWTGSGDGPSFIKHPLVPLSNNPQFPNTIVRTATILATVYVDGNFESDFDPLCIFDCDRKPNESGKPISSIDNIPPSDRRYWLLTVVAGLFGPQDFPILEEKLAKLYRIAFLRQQARHLGIVNGSNSQTNNETYTRKKRSNSPETYVISPTKTLNGSEQIRTRNIVINRHVYEREKILMKRQRKRIFKRESTSAIDYGKTQKLPVEILFQNNQNTSRKIFDRISSQQRSMQIVSVMIHSVSTGDDDKENNVIAGGESNKLDSNSDKINLSNQTEIVYSVIVGGKPVLAVTAADDMQFVSRDEAIKIMENDVVLKAEPYLKEPLATPLIPSYMNGNSKVTAIFTRNPWWLFILMAVAMILLVLLLITLLLFGRSKRREAEMKRQSATQALVQKINVDDDINTIRSDSLNGDVGVDNLAFEKEKSYQHKKPPPVLHFPLPPLNRPTSSSSSSTSDSSVYYPKRRHKFNSIQDLLEQKDMHREEDKEDEIYSKVKEKSLKKENTKPHKHRYRRKYKVDNRVGSVEHVDVHSPQTSSYQSDGGIGYEDGSLTSYRVPNEAYNPNVSHYNTNKLMNDQSFTVVEVDRRKGGKSKSKQKIPAEAMNKELIQQHGRGSADSNSIGSFLSMASVRSFPRCSVPEPLSRVLEPVSVTHLDHSDADYEQLKNYRMVDSQKSLDLDEIDEDIYEQEMSRTQSDGADPGVIGPVVWEMHKKGFDQSTNSVESPLRDPLVTRNRFEGLLEGAMKLYGSSSYSNCHSLMNQATEEEQFGQMPGAIKSKEIRGKSAATIRLTSRTSGLLSRTDFHPMRPMTAGPPDIHEHPTPPITRAWASGSGTPLVRPLSAGIYHKPVIQTDPRNGTPHDRIRAMSSSPIIDAIQNELKRINREEK